MRYAVNEPVRLFNVYPYSKQQLGLLKWSTFTAKCVVYNTITLYHTTYRSTTHYIEQNPFTGKNQTLQFIGAYTSLTR